MGRRKQLIVIDGDELNLSLTELHEELKKRGHFKWGYQLGKRESDGALVYTLNSKEGVGGGEQPAE